MGHQKLKTVQKHLFEHHTWSRINFEKSQFSAPIGPIWAPTCYGLSLQLAASYRA